MAITSNSTAAIKKNVTHRAATPISTVIARFWQSPKFALVPLLGIALIFAVPGFSIAIFVLLIPFLVANLKTKIKLPGKLPMSSGLKIDPNSPAAGKENQFNPAQGITCLGVCSETNKQVWEDSDNERRHNVTLATTGAGKTYGLRWHMLMALVQTTGVIAVDGKGDIELPLETVNLIRRFLRDEDLLILNFKQGNKNVYAETGKPRTNTFNPLATGSTTYISEVLKALLSGDDPKAKSGDVWQKRAESMVELIAKLVTYKRDHGNFKIRPGTIRDLLDLKALCKVYCDEDIPQEYKNGLRLYFNTLGDIDEAKVKSFANGEEAPAKVMEQHGYVIMQIQPALQVLADQYGFIFDTDTPDIDLKDVVTNNRFLLVLLPAMEVSEGTLRNTGKIILAALKGMISGELGDEYAGNVDDILNSRVTKDPAPMKIFFDECGYYAAIPGIEILPAQGRGLGFAFYFIGQTYTDLEKGGKETAEIIWGNANNKTIGKTESDATYQKVSDRVGEVEVLKTERVNLREGALATARVGADSLSYSREKRLHMSDLTCLREGQYYQIFNNELLSIRTGDPSIKSKVQETRYNQFIGLDPIPKSTQEALSRDYTSLINQYKSSLKDKKNNKKPKPVKLDSFPHVRSIVGKLVESKATGKLSNAPIIDWQAMVQSLLQKDTDAIEQLNSSVALDILFGENQPGSDAPINSKENSQLIGEETREVEVEEISSINNLEVPVSDDRSWTEIALEADNSPPKSNVIYEEDSEIRDFEDVEDEDEDDEGGMKDASSIETELEFYQYQVETGQITEEEHRRITSEITNEMNSGNLQLQEEVDVMLESEFESDPFENHNLATIGLETNLESASSIDSIESISNQYPSENQSEAIAKKLTKEKVMEIIDNVDTCFNNLDFS